MKDKPATIVFIAPSKIRNSFLLRSPVTSLPMTAACPDPRPGRKETKGDAIKDASRALFRDFFLIFTCFNLQTFCFGIFCFFIIEVIKEDAPNRPVSKGRMGSFMLRLKEAIPKNPANRKMSIAQSLDFFSK